MELNKVEIINIYKITDITNEYKNYSDEKKYKYRSVFADDMILYEPIFKVVCKVRHNGITEIITKIWTKSELELIEKNRYYLA